MRHREVSSILPHRVCFTVAFIASQYTMFVSYSPLISNDVFGSTTNLLLFECASMQIYTYKKRKIIWYRTVKMTIGLFVAQNICAFVSVRFFFLCQIFYCDRNSFTPFHCDDNVRGCLGYAHIKYSVNNGMQLLSKCRFFAFRLCFRVSISFFFNSIEQCLIWFTYCLVAR